ncbi:testis-expressed protein 11-like [Argiope bruennichi]|uniref:testis-expressed protein 11-like n=1 Tax=Argiope bruennichi TaxID=94029 RepID=UPI00249436CB|nr:testis-expressed protein 11-like [Argiope bruennichi]
MEGENCSVSHGNSIMKGNQNTIADILSHYHKSGDFSTSFISEVVEKLNGKGYYRIAIDFIHKERQRRLELKEKFYLFSLELQVHLKTSSLEKASALLEDAIRLAKSTDVTLKQTNSFCKVLFSYADRLFKSQSFMQSLTWYKKFLKFVETTRISGAAITFLKQRICLCYLEMNEGQLAKQMFMKIECPNSNTDFLHLYLGLQIAIMCEDQELADIALKYTGGYDHSLEEVLLACCRKALSIGKTAFICKILELLIEKFNVNEGSLSHLKLSQILIKLYLGSTEMMEEQEKIIICLRKALEISEHVEKGNATEDMMEWFCRVAWNMALKEGTKVKNVFEFFYICCQFLEKLKGSYVRLKNALIFVIAAGIQTLRENSKSEGMEEESKDISRKILSSIDICRNIEKDNTRILSLLHVYEFETRLLMEDPSAESILRRMLQMPFVDAEALQLVASIAYEDSSNNFKLVTIALEGAINKTDQTDSRIGQLYHSLLQVLFFTQEYVTSSVEEQTMNVCKTVLKRLEEDDSFQEYPEMKVLWLMTKCWNWGVHKLSAGNPTSGHEWCTLAMKLLQKLKGLKGLHEEKLQALFSSYFGTQDVPWEQCPWSSSDRPRVLTYDCNKNTGHGSSAPGQVLIEHGFSSMIATKTQAMGAVPLVKF